MRSVASSSIATGSTTREVVRRSKPRPNCTSAAQHYGDDEVYSIGAGPAASLYSKGVSRCFQSSDVLDQARRNY
nr:hypothetical protein CFP56_53671 [Quercus suber]